MNIGAALIEFAVNRPRLVTGVMVLSVLAFALAVALPSLWPGAVPMLHPVRVDTDPENMLPHDEPVRVFHDRMKKDLALYDMVVVGVVNEGHEAGVFNPASLAKVYELAEYAKTLRWPDPADPSRMEGVVVVDVLAPSTVDHIEQAGPGALRFEWLMPRPPATDEEARAVRDKARRIPFLNGTLVSDDGKALALYLPLTRKDLSYRVATALGEKIAALGGPEEFHVTGLPVAEDTFGVEMFKQMALSAPLAMLAIFVLMFLFFRKVLLIVQPLIVAVVAVVWTMGLLVATGHTIHIMSSMIPIFIMPISVLDSIHILSEFFDRYQETRDRRKTVLRVMRTLFVPMLYTSLTTAAGFASLAITPIPPVQVFGVFVAVGVMVAWLFTVTFIPASVMFIPQRYLGNFGLARSRDQEHSQSPLSRLLRHVGRGTYRWAKPILALTVAAGVLAAIGVSRIRINDNPTKWFEPAHPIRVADRVLNRHFGGTYMAYLALEAPAERTDAERADRQAAVLRDLRRRGDALAQAGLAGAREVFHGLADEGGRRTAEPLSLEAWLEGLEGLAGQRLDDARGDEADAWDQAALFLGAERQRSETFKQPEVLRYVEALQAHLLTTGVVGKSNSLADIVKTVYRELLEGKPEQFRVPDTAQAVAQCLIQFQSSHRPRDLDHFVTPDYRRTSLWVQLQSGDNRDMQKVVDAMAAYAAAHPPPVPLRQEWFGLTYINIIWQDRMVVGMLQSLLGSFLVVLLMMIVLYRSALWGLLAMVPLTVTIAGIYGAVGFLGKDYDMPIAVLSALSLGLAVDYAIHFLSRAREVQRERPGPLAGNVPALFGEPARAITRNVIVIGVGFLPLLAAPLVPYQTVGVFMAAILLLAGVVTLLVLPALMRVLEPLLFPKTPRCCLTCNCLTCVVTAATAVGAVVLNVQLFLALGWNDMILYSILAVAVLAGVCGLVSRREKCRLDREAQAKGDAP